MHHDEWMDTNKAHVGDTVCGDYIADMMNALPPKCMRSTCSQCGEPYSFAYDELGECRNTYLTWHLVERHGNEWSHESIWMFDGACFAGLNENHWFGFFV